MFLNVLQHKGSWHVVINIWPHQDNGGGQVVVQGVPKAEALRVAAALADSRHQVNLIELG